jgi:hypothetical protein
MSDDVMRERRRAIQAHLAEREAEAQALLGQPFMTRPAPEGYRKPRGDEEVGAFYTCLTCGAAVSPSTTELHNAWHEQAAQ